MVFAWRRRMCSLWHRLRFNSLSQKKQELLLSSTQQHLVEDALRHCTALHCMMVVQYRTESIVVCSRPSTVGCVCAPRSSFFPFLDDNASTCYRKKNGSDSSSNTTTPCESGMALLWCDDADDDVGVNYYWTRRRSIVDRQQ